MGIPGGDCSPGWKHEHSPETRPTPDASLGGCQDLSPSQGLSLGAPEAGIPWPPTPEPSVGKSLDALAAALRIQKRLHDLLAGDNSTPSARFDDLRDELRTAVGGPETSGAGRATEGLTMSVQGSAESEKGVEGGTEPGSTVEMVGGRGS
jgi:hypothetical protein